MADLSTTYLGLTLKNPLVAASSGLTDSIDGIKKLENAGIGAVVLKSIFEEEILNQTASLLNEAKENPLIYSDMSETLDYIDLHVKESTLSNYLSLIKEAKKQTLVPVIASINCVSAGGWTEFAKKVEHAGADALELNVFTNPISTSLTNIEELYVEISKKVVQALEIPVAVKISKYLTRPAQTIENIAASGVKGLVLFNRFYAPDIDLEKMQVVTSGKISNGSEYLDSLRWIGLMADKVNCDLAASNGIHSAETAIKLILAGASAVQLCSVLYEKGLDCISKMLSGLDQWMEQHKYANITQLKGKLAMNASIHGSAYERMQFMKYFSGIG
jgi:dihydroorotate dehydrogenase (fumarate)